MPTRVCQNPFQPFWAHHVHNHPSQKCRKRCHNVESSKNAMQKTPKKVKKACLARVWVLGQSAGKFLENAFRWPSFWRGHLGGGSGGGLGGWGTPLNPWGLKRNLLSGAPPRCALFCQRRLNFSTSSGAFSLSCNYILMFF